jgi:adenine-specific DNA-methyltransferase
MYKIETPTGKLLDPPKGRCWGATEPEYLRLRDVEKRVYFPKNGNGRPRTKQYAFEESGLAPMTWWTAKDCGDNEESKKEVLELFHNQEAFATPKPERLIRQILLVATMAGDLVLDSFLGSGTTAAVAHKLTRDYIGIESGEHAVTYCKPRLDAVIAGEQGGISTLENWRGGGGYRFYELGEQVFDDIGRVNPCVRFATLAAHIWFSETGQPMVGKANSPLLGVHDGKAYYLLFNGILGDKRPNGGNVLTAPVLMDLPPFAGPKIVFGERTLFGRERLQRERITFRQIPYEMKVR